MSAKETKELLLQCDAGIKTAVNCIEEVLDKTRSDSLHKSLEDSRQEHYTLMNDVADLLKLYDMGSEEPNPMARVMSKIKIDAELLITPTDAKIAELMTDGCNMGIKKLSETKNRCTAAEAGAVSLTDRIVKCEQNLQEELRAYL